MRLCQSHSLLVFECRIDQDHPSDLIRVLAGVNLHVGPAERVAYQHVGSSDPRITKQSMKLLYDLLTRAWLGTRVTPTHTCPVVGAHAHGLGELRLNQLPIQHGTAEPGIHYYGRCSCFSSAIEVQAVAAYIDHFAERRISALVDLGGDELIDHARKQQEENQPCKPD